MRRGVVVVGKKGGGKGETIFTLTNIKQTSGLQDFGSEAAVSAYESGSSSN